MSDPARQLPARAAELVRELGLQPHPEGGWYRELFRAGLAVTPADGRAMRSALTTIDFLLVHGQCSAWHHVRSDEVWHLLEGEGVRLWTLPPTLDALVTVELRPGGTPLLQLRHVVPAHWWQAAEPIGAYAYVGATVGPGFDFADFAFGRDDPALVDALARVAPETRRLL